MMAISILKGREDLLTAETGSCSSASTSVVFFFCASRGYCVVVLKQMKLFSELKHSHFLDKINLHNNVDIPMVYKKVFQLDKILDKL